MIGSVRMEALLRVARALKVARVVLVGDTKQLKAVDAGQPFRLAAEGGHGDRDDEGGEAPARPGAAG